MESEVFSVAIHYQKLTETELPTFIDMRIQQLREEGATEDIDLKSALFDYYRRHLTDGTFVSWLALDEIQGRVVVIKWNVFCRKTALFWMPKRKNRAAFQHVYPSELSPTGHC